VRRLVGTYALCHFAVDLCCVATVLCVVAPALGSTGIVTAALAVVAYDLVAFMLQLPIGAALDGCAGGMRSALLSYGLVVAGVLASYVPAGACMAASVALVAVGNALFHCAGGVDALGMSHGRATPSGIFIATGAFGVFLGARASLMFGAVLRVVLLALMAASALVTRGLMSNSRTSGIRRRIEAPRLAPAAAGAVALLAVTVALRSYAGMVMAFPWKGDATLALASILGVVAGKAAGGIVADRIGLERASVISLGVSAPLFLLAFEHPAAGIVATLLFNFTMPITLISLAELLPGNRGLAFGIASFSLAVGALPSFAGIMAASGPALAALSLASLAFLLTGLAAARRAHDG